MTLLLADLQQLQFWHCCKKLMFVFTSSPKCKKYDFAFLCQILIIMGNHKDVIKAVKGKNIHFTLGQSAIMIFSKDGNRTFKL